MIFEYILSFIVRTLNLKSLDQALPIELSDVFDNKKYSLTRGYTRDIANFSYITSTFSLTISLLFIFGGIYNVLDNYSRSFGCHDILTGLIFFALLFFLVDFLL